MIDSDLVTSFILRCKELLIIVVISDFGLEILADRVGETNFPWLMSNVIYNETGRPLGEGKIMHIIEWNGKRIGMVMKIVIMMYFHLFALSFKMNLFVFIVIDGTGGRGMD